MLAFEVEGGQNGAVTQPALTVDALLLFCDDGATEDDDDEPCDPAAVTTDG